MRHRRGCAYPDSFPLHSQNVFFTSLGGKKLLGRVMSIIAACFWCLFNIQKLLVGLGMMSVTV
jgi:hypothetical protein